MKTIKRPFSIKASVFTQTKTVYIPVYHNIYHDGSSFRVRVTRNKERVSKNFTKLKDAVAFRRTLVYA